MFVSLMLEEWVLAQTILLELEAWAHDLGYFFCFETFNKQKEAIAISKQDTIVENYEPYVGLENSICMRKPI
jgi:hypothetical protein